MPRFSRQVRLPRRPVRPRLAVERLEDRTVPALVTELPLTFGAAAPSGITAGPSGDLWFTETGVNKIGRITTAGLVTEFTLATPLSSPTGIVLGPDGALWFTEFGADKIGRIDTFGNITEFNLTVGAAPLNITVGPPGDGAR